MDWLVRVDWSELFVLQQSLLEIFVRGTLMYLFIFLLLRLSLRREVGMVELSDILMIVLLADAAQNGMAGDYHSITAGILTVSVIAFWNVVLDRLAFHVPALHRLVTPPPVQLVMNGKIMRRNMRREGITDEDLWGQLRVHGIDDLAIIKSAYLEANGDISVIQKRPRSNSGASKRQI